MSREKIKPPRMVKQSFHLRGITPLCMTVWYNCRRCGCVGHRGWVHSGVDRDLWRKPA